MPVSGHSVCVHTCVLPLQEHFQRMHSEHVGEGNIVDDDDDEEDEDEDEEVSTTH